MPAAMVMSTERIADLLTQLENDGHPAARELVRAVLELHGAALGALMEKLADDPRLIASIAGDERVGAVLLLHGLHPEPPEERVRRALELIPEISIQSLTVAQGALCLRVARVRCRSGSPLRERIEQAVLAAAPELVAVSIEGLSAAKPVPIPVVVDQPAVPSP